MQPGFARPSSRLRFRPRWWSVVLAAAACVAFVLLGNWQSGRADEKRARAAAQRLEAVRGELAPDTLLFLDNKLHRGRPGYHVLQVLKLPAGGGLLVNRGWVAAGPMRGQLPPVATPTGPVELRGLRLEHLPRAFAPSGDAREGRVWQNATPAEVGAWAGIALQPGVLEEHEGPEDGLVRDWPRADADVAVHESYALQWYSFAVLSVALCVGLGLRRDAA